MIIGNGLIAKSLHNIDHPETLFFASGVSNSLEKEQAAFDREFLLLKQNIEQNPHKKLVYFSTLSILDQSKTDSLYTLHKKKLEKFIAESCDDFVILRIGNIVGAGGNPNTLFNFLKEKISHGEKFYLHKKARRLLTDIDDVSGFLGENLNLLNRQTINFAFPYHYTLAEIISVLENTLQKTAHCEETDEGDFYKVEFDHLVHQHFSGKTPEEYLQILAEKYI